MLQRCLLLKQFSITIGSFLTLDDDKLDDLFNDLNFGELFPSPSKRLFQTVLRSSQNLL